MVLEKFNSRIKGRAGADDPTLLNIPSLVMLSLIQEHVLGTHLVGSLIYLVAESEFRKLSDNIKLGFRAHGLESDQPEFQSHTH